MGLLGFRVARWHVWSHAGFLLNSSVYAGTLCRGRCAGERGVPGGGEDEEGLQKGLGAGELTYLTYVDLKYSWYEVHF